MSIGYMFVLAILKSLTEEDRKGSFIKEMYDLSIDESLKTGIKGIEMLLCREKKTLKRALSPSEMQKIDIKEENIEFVGAEVQKFLSKVDITDEVFRQCKYDKKVLETYLWKKYVESKGETIERESDIKKSLNIVTDILIKTLYESEDFVQNFLIQISNTVDNIQKDLQSIFKYVNQLSGDKQEILEILRTMIKIDKSENIESPVLENKFQNNKKDDYIRIWNGKLFLSNDGEANPQTLKNAFVVPDYILHRAVESIGFTETDSLEQIIKKFIEYEHSADMLIMGAPGIGKSSISAWIADKYAMDDRIIILRFRDWDQEDFQESLLKTICEALNCKKRDLEGKILILEGFDEIKILDRKNELLYNFCNEVNDFDDLKYIITSRPNYIDEQSFYNVLELKVFDIERIKIFYRNILGKSLERTDKISSNLDVLGIPVILYLALMSGVEITENPTKPELYNRIFGEKRGIFNKFSDGKSEYSKGSQLMRNPENIKNYLNFLCDVGYKIFLKGGGRLGDDEYEVPNLAFFGKQISILEFPIKYFFENSNTDIEFVHNSIYEYFVAEYFYRDIRNMLIESSGMEDKLADKLGEWLIGNKVLSLEIYEFLEYKINENLLDKYNFVLKTFHTMLQNGMTRKLEGACITPKEREMLLFSRMLDFVHLWRRKAYKMDPSKLSGFIAQNSTYRLNLVNVDLQNTQLTNIDLSKANLNGAILTDVDLSDANLASADLSGANMQRAKLANANLANSNLEGTDLRNAQLPGANLAGANLTDAKLQHTNLKNTNLQKSILVKANFSNAELIGANLSDANLSEAILENTALKKCNFSRACMRSANLMKARFGDAILAGADLTDADLITAELDEAYFGNATLLRTDLRGTDLRNVDFRNANLSQTKLGRADLRGVILQDVMLDDPHLDDAIIENALFGEVALTSLEKKYDLSELQIFVRVDGRILPYREFRRERGW